MNEKDLIAVVEAELLTELSNRLREFFSDKITTYEAHYRDLDDFPKEFFTRKETLNPRSAITPIAQVNIVANVSFHLVAQQIALLFHARKNINKQEVLNTTFDNIRRLVVTYMHSMQEGEHDEG